MISNECIVRFVTVERDSRSLESELKLSVNFHPSCYQKNEFDLELAKISFG